MFDEIQALRTDPGLFRLLAHYAVAGAVDREAWQDRLMELDHRPAKDLVQLHGLLLAYGWIEQNTGVVRGCYRVTTAGQRAVKQVRAEHEGGDEETAAA